MANIKYTPEQLRAMGKMQDPVTLNIYDLPKAPTTLATPITPTAPNLAPIEAGIKTAQQQVATLTPQVQAITTPVVAPITTPTPPVLPTPTTPNANDAYYNSLAQQLADSQSALTAARDKQLADTQAQKETTQKELDAIRASQQAGLEQLGVATAEEKQKKLDYLTEEKARFDENYNIVQGLTGQLNTLLTQGQDLINQQKAETGLSSIRTPRINQTISDVTAQAGVIQASISAYNGQMNQAQSQLTTASNVITSAYSDQLDYYKTLYNFAESKASDTNQKLITLTSDEKAFLNDKITTLENNVKNAQDNADYIKKLMMDPATALLAGEAGINLNMTPQQVNATLADAAYLKDKREYIKTMALDEKVNISAEEARLKPANEVSIIPDARGNNMYFWKKSTGTTTEINAENYDQVKQEAASLFEIDRMRNGDKKVSPDLYQEMRNKIPATMRNDFDKYFSPLLSSESKQRFGIEVAQPSMKDIFQQYKDGGYTRAEVENQWKFDNKLTKIPTPVVQSLDEVFGESKPWYKFW